MQHFGNGVSESALAYRAGWLATVTTAIEPAIASVRRHGWDTRRQDKARRLAGAASSLDGKVAGPALQ